MKHIPSLLTILGLLCLTQAAKAQHNVADSARTVFSPQDVVGEKRMNKGLVTTALDALSGQAAGVAITTGDSRMAMLSSVRVRGTTSLTGGNDPLVIIDGVYSDLATLSGIYPADIESFTILKDASETAPYGTRGASGVIQVKTKKGHGGKFHIAYDGNVGFERVSKNLDMLDRNGYLQTARQLGLYANDGGYDTNFPKAITRTGWVQNHHLAFSGGTEQGNYRASLGVMQHSMVVVNNSSANFVAKMDLSQKAFNNLLTINMGVFGSSQSNKYLFDAQHLFYSAAAQNPTYPAGRNAQGGWDRNGDAEQITSPFALLQQKNNERSQIFNTHAQMLFSVSRDITLTAFGSYSYNNNENAQFCPTWVWAQGQAWRGTHRQEQWLGNVMAELKHTWQSGHNLHLTALSEYQITRERGFWTSVKGFSNNNFGYDNLGGGAIFPYGTTGSDYDSPKLLSFLLGANYAYKSKYELKVNVRTDGSSMVASQNRWGFFPSVSAQWNIGEESFMKRQRLLSRLIMRMGYGLSGNLGGIESYNSLYMFMPNGTVPWNGISAVTLVNPRNVNPDLKWETKGTYNIGADMGLWHDRIMLTAEYYYSKTWNMLYQYDVPVPPFTYNKLLANLGKMSNQGLELGLAVTPIQNKDMELNINMNLTFQKNKLISLNGNYKGTEMTASDIVPIGGLIGAGLHGENNNIVYQIIGQPLGVFYLPHCTGMKQNSDGSYSYVIADLDKNGETNIEDGGDRYVAGQATPKWMLGSNISFRYKNFDASAQINGAFGHKIFNGTSFSYMDMSIFPDYNVMKDAPRHNIKDQRATDFWLEKGDYVNIEYLTMGWNIPVNSERCVISAMRLSLSVNNLATITAYHGLTPMINSSVVNNTLGIDDKRSFPPYRSFCFGVSISF